MFKASRFTSGNAFVNLINHALPLVLLSLINIIYNICDYYFLGHIANTNLIASLTNAISICSLFIWLATSFINIISVGVEILLPKYVIKNDDTNNFSIIISSIIASIIFIILLILFKNIYINSLNIDDQTHMFINDYLLFLIPAIGIMLINRCFNSILLSYGKTMVILFSSIIGIVLNIILDYIIIIKFDSLAFGEGLSTFIANMITLFINIVIIYKLKVITSYNFNYNFINKVITLSCPIMISSLFFTIINMLITNVITNQVGADLVSVKGMGSNIEAISYQVFGTSIGSILTVFISQNLANNHNERNKDVIKKITLVVSIIIILYSLLIYNNANNIFNLLTNDQNLINLGTIYLQILAFSQIFMAYEGIYTGILNGYNKTKISSSISIIGNIMLLLLLILNSSNNPISVINILLIINILRGLTFILITKIIQYKITTVKNG